jgi:signal recognition particle receptor subunit alpha
VVAYQNILKLTYIDKFLTEIQLRFRDMYKQAIESGKFNHDFSGFDTEFHKILKECEADARNQSHQSQKPRSYHESDKANRTVASMIETKKGGFLSNLVSGSSDDKPSGNNKSTSKSSGVKSSLKENDEGIESANDDSMNNGNLSDSTNINNNNNQSSEDVSKLINLPSSGPKQMRKFEKKT